MQITGLDAIKKFIKLKGWILYEPMSDNLDYPFFFARKGNDIVAIDISTSWVSELGVGFLDQKRFERHIRLSKKYNMPFWIFFVDDKGTIHYNTLKNLEIKINVGDIVYPKVLTTVDDVKKRFYCSKNMLHILGVNGCIFEMLSDPNS